MAKKKSGAAGDMKKFYMILGLVAVVAIVAVGAAMRAGTGATGPVDLGEVTDEELVALAQGMIYGDPNAPVTIMEFGDYQCPACGQFAGAVKPQVDLAYIETGQAKLVFHDFPLPGHPNAFPAARAARCAGAQDQYFAYHDVLFRNQQQWSLKGNPAGEFVSYAGEVGLDQSAFRECLESDQFADVVSANRMLGERLGVGGTPTLFVHTGQGPAKRLGGFQFIDVQRAMEAWAEEMSDSNE